jgi:poly(A) polymerase
VAPNPVTTAAPGEIPSLRAAAWLNAAPTQAVFSCLTKAGWPARAVGGAVRNTLLGLAVTDIDIATPAPPETVQHLARAAGLKSVPTGIEHGTVTVIADHIPFEVTTLRRDVTTDGRRATVAFTQEWAEDAARRDFTMNALYCDPDGRVHDPVGGWPDLQARRVRFIGEATTRIREDALRILRLFRFHATYGQGAIDRDAIGACVRERQRLAILSAERVRAELLKLLVAPRAIGGVRAMFDHGLLVTMLGAVPYLAGLERLVAIEAALDRAPDGPLRLAALTVRTPEAAQHVSRRLKLSNAERDVLTHAGRHCAPELPNSHADRVRRYRLGPDCYERDVQWRWMLSARPADDAVFAASIAMGQSWTPPRFPIDGSDLMQRGLSPGPAFGQTLARLEQAWTSADFQLTRQQLLRMIED